MVYGILWLDTALFAVLGLLVGSFLNVVIHRLPLMLERQWAQQCAQLASDAAASTTSTPPTPAPPFNLVVPRSRCPHCGHAIAWWENLPVFSYLALRGRCSACKAPISVRYPLVELTTAALFGWCAWQTGSQLLPSPLASALVWCAFCALLLSMALIDWDTTLLPDDLTLPLLWLGLVAAAMHWTAVDLNAALWGAVAGYASLWSIYWVFKLVTGKEGMGYGDFKLYAALGAWFGWQMLIPLILLASVVGAAVGIVLKFRQSLRPGGYMPFGPFLAGAGFGALLLGRQTLLTLVGF